ncbi:HNH endonuclease [Rhizobium ruizarguesonis]|uniref:HNH endonuclease n=1 Tax=Rhizobium ruizarguesonis TaxID=2081791 RepID=UPI0013EE8783|nr:HNH endonuclease [Rhizobium ruizarguesonis]
MIDCIYCLKTKKESEEHVVPAGLGGDDRDWLLKDCVCSECNTVTFSPLELKFLRSSPIAIARLFKQPSTRKSGSQRGVPTVQPGASYLADPETQTLLEQELLAGGEPLILSQLVLQPPREVHLHSANLESGREFISSLVKILGLEVQLVRKFREGIEIRFEVTRLMWMQPDERYDQDGDAEIFSKAPNGAKSMIWMEGLDGPQSALKEFKLPPRVFQKSSGQFVCKVESPAHVPVLLSIMRPQLQTLVVPDDVPVVMNDAPGIHQQYNFSMAAHDRVLAKIGMNLCAKIFGADFVRQSEFNTVRDYVHSGSGHILKIPIDKLPADDPFAEQLDHHVFVLTSLPVPAERCAALVFQAKLYDGPMEHFILAKFGDRQAAISETMVIVNDYRQHRIECRTIAGWEEIAREQDDSRCH